MMEVTYMMLDSNAPVTHTVTDMHRFRDLCRAVHCHDGVGPPIALELCDGSESSLLYVPMPEGVVVMVSADDDHSYHAAYPHAADEEDNHICVFTYMGAYTEVLREELVPVSEAWRIVEAYFDGGFPSAFDAGHWESDW